MIKPYGQAFAESWHGIGPEAYGIEIPNESTTYRAFLGTVQTKAGVESRAGILVEQKGREKVFACMTDTLITNMEETGLPERPEAP